jgi:hypothetical protein
LRRGRWRLAPLIGLLAFLAGGIVAVTLIHGRSRRHGGGAGALPGWLRLEALLLPGDPCRRHRRRPAGETSLALAIALAAVATLATSAATADRCVPGMKAGCPPADSGGVTTLPSRLRRHLTYANVMASIAVFVALGGVGYAATTINGNSIVKRTIGAGKLKDGTLTSKQVKQNALTGSVINESSLATVPSAETAVSATSATSAASAETANSATTAQSTETADHALSADTATSATSADSATTAADADAVGGFTAQQLLVACPTDTELYGGMCWDEGPRPAANWIVASSDCGDAGGRLPSLSELIAYVLQPGTQVSGQHWSGDASDFEVGSGEESALTRGESATAVSHSPVHLGYRCLFYRAN